VIKPKLASLESLRGLLALWVVVAHVTARVISEDTIAGFHARAPLEPLLPVYVFMILSGFVIFHLLERQRESYGAFILRRFFRLAPLYLVVLLVAAWMVPFELRTLDNLFWRNPHIYDAIKIHHETLDHFWPYLWSHVLLLHGLIPETVLPDANFTFLSQGWSISLEWQFYLLAPLVFWVIAGRRYLGPGLLAAAMAGLLFLGYPSIGFLPNQFAWFALGIASFYAYRSSGWFARINPRTHDLLLPVIGVLLFFLLRNPWPVLVWLLVLDVIMAERAGLETFFTAALRRILELPPLQWLGRISYSVYLVHLAILYVVLRAITRLDEHLGGWKVLALALPATLILTLLVSALTYRWIEVPGMALGRALSARLGAKPLLQPRNAA
jgi:peptidoglycan/LPS O-acetylase OafA/YrhL